MGRKTRIHPVGHLEQLLRCQNDVLASENIFEYSQMYLVFLQNYNKTNIRLINPFTNY